jgi:hypothetical protein
MKNLLQIGSGIFIFLIASSVNHLVEVVIFDFLLILKVDHHLNFYLTNLVSYSSLFIVLLVLVKRFEKKFKLNFEKKILLELFITYFIIQLLQFLYSFYLSDYLFINYTEKYKLQFIETIANSAFYMTLNPIFMYISHIFIFIFFYLKIKKNTDL